MNGDAPTNQADTGNAQLVPMQNERRDEDPSSPMVAKMTSSMKAIDDELKTAAGKLRTDRDGEELRAKYARLP
jgi:hypothetical protein